MSVSKSKGDPEREAKWLARSDEWARLSALSTNEHITDRCLREVRFCQMMADFWARSW